MHAGPAQAGNSEKNLPMGMLKNHQYPDHFFKLITGTPVSHFYYGNFEPYSLPRFTVITIHNTCTRYT